MGADERTVVITGATSGLGRCTARVIAAAHDGWHVVVTSRDPQRAQACAQAITAQHAAPVTGLALDLAALADVRRFVSELTGLPPIHALICNAGILMDTALDDRTVDGFDLTFATNHLGHFLLSRLLLPMLAPSGRIVFIASSTHDPARRTGLPAPRYTTARELACPPPWANEEDARTVGYRRYTTSKLFNVLTTYELARHLCGPQSPSKTLTVNAFDPGLMPGTGTARDYVKFPWNFLAPILARTPGINFHPVTWSATALVRMITDPALQHTTGTYFSSGVPRRSSAASYQLPRAAELWATSSDLAGLQ